MKGKKLKRDATLHPIKSSSKSKIRNELPCLRFEMKGEKPKLKADANEKNDLGEKLCEITGIDSVELAVKMTDVARWALVEGDKECRYNTILHSIREDKPFDLHEARLSLQATVLYEQGMVYLRRTEKSLVDGAFTQDWSQIFMKHAIKLLDLHTKTVEALTRYRQRGEQKITVQYVNVENGSQAIVNNGSMVAGGRGGQQHISEVPHGS